MADEGFPQLQVPEELDRKFDKEIDMLIK
jgi:hypothetical protein